MRAKRDPARIAGHTAAADERREPAPECQYAPARQRLAPDSEEVGEALWRALGHFDQAGGLAGSERVVAAAADHEPPAPSVRRRDPDPGRHQDHAAADEDLYVREEALAAGALAAHAAQRPCVRDGVPVWRRPVARSRSE